MKKKGIKIECRIDLANTRSAHNVMRIAVEHLSDGGSVEFVVDGNVTSTTSLIRAQCAQFMDRVYITERTQ